MSTSFIGLPEIIDMPMVEAAIRQKLGNKIATFYPETGPLRRQAYPKHMAFFAAGAKHEERLACCGNRVGKTEGLFCYELTLHLTGDYPFWWEGRRFNRPITAWVAGKTAETTRDILQAKLLGKTHRDPGAPRGEVLGLGTGMIPAASIVSTSPKTGISNAIDTAWIRHKTGGYSQLGFKSYGRDRDSFEGTERDFIGLDEEPPSDVDDECTMRLMSTRPGEPGGLKVICFTPLEGYTEVVQKFFESTDPGKWYTQIGWNDAPHLLPEEIAKLSKKYNPSQLRARSLGEPSLGEGAIYPKDVQELLVDDFQIPNHWPRGFGMDVGKTAIVWGALNRDTDCLYLYREYYSEEYNPILHAAAIKGIKDRDRWIPGVIDPGSLGSSQVDGRKLFNIYTEMGIDLTAADTGVESGIHEVWMRMSTERLKVFRSLTRWQNEFGRYHRIKSETKLGIFSQIVKKADHLMDAMQYLITSGLDLLKTPPALPDPDRDRPMSDAGGFDGEWMG
jgi:phage terminase large subunit-like protein